MNKFEAHYADKGNSHIHFAVITCLERLEEIFTDTYDEHLLERLGFKLFAFDDMLDDSIGIDTESDIFNEFWLRSW